MGYRITKAAKAHWRRSNQMQVMNTDLGKQLGANQTGSRLWRLDPGQASTRHRHLNQEEVYFLLEGRGKLRVDDEVLDLSPHDAVRVDPEAVRQLFNDTESTQLWLVFGAPPEQANTLEMDDEKLALLYPDGPQALPPELS